MNDIIHSILLSLATSKLMLDKGPAGQRGILIDM